MEKPRPAGTHGELSRRLQVSRRLGRMALHAPMLRERTLHADPEGLARAEELNGEGYGVLVLINHPSRRDPVQAMGSIASSPQFEDKRITGPIAAHQTMHGIVPKVAEILGVSLHEVVTQSTIDKGKNDGHELGFGSIAYVKDATRTLRDGGIAVMAPQGTREPTLEYNGQESVQGLLRMAGHKNPNIAVHFMAFGYKGRWGINQLDDYSKRKGLNPFRRYDAIHGPTYTLEEAKQMAAKHQNLDAWAFAELSKIVPPSYLPKKS